MLRTIQRFNGVRRRQKQLCVIVCCDCGLSHIYKIDVGGNHHLYVTTWQDKTITRQQRKTKRYAGLKLPYSKRTK